jgi:hypothetical protein
MFYEWMYDFDDSGYLPECKVDLAAGWYSSILALAPALKIVKSTSPIYDRRVL